MAEDTEEEETVAPDEQREALLAQLTEHLGDALVGSHLKPHDDLWIRVSLDAWATTADVLRNKLRARYFDFLSAIDWLPSPYGRSMDSEVEIELGLDDPAEPNDTAASTPETGYAGGDTRFQVFARVLNVADKWGVHVKADVPDGDLRVPTWIGTYAGANWHEREVREMFGIEFEGHPDLRNLYLPGDFIGNPMRKDYPLLARQVKPWPGIVDVEPLPGEDEEDEAKDGTKDGEGAPA
ncbi:MAG: NADH-quinone oxidoreductase subunit C [Acidimicrobiales bacterium]|nr:NADH-quinone oxidoreductase subunit C [Acidimicrobiales bacterium]